MKIWTITSDGHLKHMDQLASSGAACPLSSTSTNGYDMLMAQGSKTTYQHESDRDLIVEAKFAVPSGATGRLIFRQYHDYDSYYGYSIIINGGNKRPAFAERLYMYSGNSWGYYDSVLGRFKSDCIVPTDATSGMQHISIRQ